MQRVLTYKGAVMTWECDSNRHMNVMYYINKFEHAGHNFLMEMGLDFDRNGDMGMVVLEQNIKYLKEVFEDDVLYVESTLLDIGNKAFTILHELYNAKTKELSASMSLVGVLFDKKERKAMVFPKDKKTELLKGL